MGKEKQVNCIDCGKEITVSLFASPKKSRCPECKNNTQRKTSPAPATTTEYGTTTEQPARMDRQPNKALHQLNCPYCKTPMTLISVMNSPMWGDMITMQCRNRGCYIKVEINERDKIEAPITATPCGTGYDIAMSSEELLKALESGDISRKFVDRLQKL